jgi:hypothetical protein
MTSLHTFVIAWPGFHDKAAKIEEGVGRDVTVLNTDEGAHEPHWVLQPREAFYSARWNKALELCRSDVMGIVCADAASTAWSRVMSRARDAFTRLPNLGVYAPFVDTHYWLADRADLTCVAGDVYESPATNGMCWFVKLDVARVVGSVDLSVNPLGWGIDFAAGAIARQMGYVIGVDTRVTVRHPAGTSYDCADALSQMVAYLAGFARPVQDDVRGLMQQAAELRERYVRRRAVV